MFCCWAARIPSFAACGKPGRPTSRACGKSAKSNSPKASTPEELIKVPDNAQYFAALGAVEFGKDEDDDVGRYRGIAKLVHYIDCRPQRRKGSIRRRRRWSNRNDDLDAFKEAYQRKKFIPADVSAAGHGRRLRRHRRRLHFHQGRAALRRTATFCAKPTSSPTAIPSRTPSTCSRSCATGRGSRREA